jgi:hypothetical protein
VALSIDVGQLARCVALKDRGAVRDIKRRLKKLNQALMEAGVDEHHEPEDLNGKEPWGCKIAGPFGLTPLRRLAAYVWVREVREEAEEFETWPAPWQAGGENGEDDAQLAYYYSDPREFLDHLMYHSDSRGYYVPIDFYDTIFPSTKLAKDVGAEIGSTQGLLADCKAVAKVIDLPADVDPKSKCFADAISSAARLGDGWWNYPLECEICLQLMIACRKSLELGSVLVFG